MCLGLTVFVCIMTTKYNNEELSDRLLSERNVNFELESHVMVSKYFKISHKYKKKSSKSLKQDGSLFFFPLKFSSINAVQKVIEISLLSVSDDLVLSTELIMLPGHCKEILKLTFRALDLSFALTANLLHQLPRVITQNYLKKILSDIAS